MVYCYYTDYKFFLSSAKFVHLNGFPLRNWDFDTNWIKQNWMRASVWLLVRWMWIKLYANLLETEVGYEKLTDGNDKRQESWIEKKKFLKIRKTI